jgi:hypothetical protein
MSATRTPCFFVQNNYVEPLTIPVARFANDNALALVDRSSTATFDASDCGVDWSRHSAVLPYGSVQFIKKLKRTPALNRYVLHDELHFSATEWLAHLGGHMLNQAGRKLPLEDIAGLLEQAPLHVRPDADDKAFTAQVFDVDTWTVMCEERRLVAGMPCWVSPVQVLGREWRCWIIDGQLIDTSQYRAAGQRTVQRDTPAEVLEYAAERARGWLPAPCVVMDLTETPEGLRIIEFNPIHCAGWYAADVPRVLKAWLAWAVAYFACAGRRSRRVQPVCSSVAEVVAPALSTKMAVQGPPS